MEEIFRDALAYPNEITAYIDPTMSGVFYFLFFSVLHATVPIIPVHCSD